MSHHVLSGSARPPIAGSEDRGVVDPSTIVHATVRVRSKAPDGALAAHVRRLSGRPVGGRDHLSREDYAAAHGASEADLDRVRDFAAAHGLAVTDSSRSRRSVALMGPAGAMAEAFGASLRSYRHAGRDYRAHPGPLGVPGALAGVVESVLGLDDRPHARPHFRIGRRPGGGPGAPGPLLESTGPGFRPNDLAALYDFPGHVDGSGQVVAVIEFAAPSGSGYRPEELRDYFASIGVPCPKVRSVSVDGGRNRPGTDPGDPDCADGEVMLDIEVLGAVAPGAEIVVYFAPNTARGFVDALDRAVHDPINRPSVVSLSWGGPEDPDDPSRDQVEQILRAAAAMGVTVCVASGDSGSDDAGDGSASVDYPASSPFALACGGTRLAASGGSIASEVAWEGHTGGGVSRLHPVPAYQSGAHVPAAVDPAGPPGRGVPDVAGAADPETGYQVLVDGRRLVIGGTSAVAPLWAGLVARLNQALGRPVGLLNPILYAHPGALRDVTSGSNGAYSAGPGWDPCTGLGSPIGTKILTALAPRPPAAP